MFNVSLLGRQRIIAGTNNEMPVLTLLFPRQSGGIRISSTASINCSSDHHLNAWLCVVKRFNRLNQRNSGHDSTGVRIC